MEYFDLVRLCEKRLFGGGKRNEFRPFEEIGQRYAALLEGDLQDGMVRLPVAAGLAADADRRGKQDGREGWEPLVYNLFLK